MENQNIKRYIEIAIVSLFFVAGWIFFFYFYPYHLYYKEQITLCVLQPDYMELYLQKPAFLAGICGDYLTQFFLWTGGGSIILISLSILTWYGIQIALSQININRYTSLWALLPLVAEWTLSCHLEYPLSMNIGLMLSVWAFTLIIINKQAQTRIVCHCCMLILLYITVGAHFFAYTLLAIFYEYKHSKSYSYPTFLLLFSILIPISGSYFYFLTVDQSYYYPLISRYMLQQPFVYLFTETLLALSILSAFIPKINKRPIVLCILTILCIVSLYKTYNPAEEKTLSFSCEAYFGHWDKVIRLNQQNKYPNYLSAYYTNLAYARQGKLCDQLLQHYQPGPHGLLLQIKESTGYIYAMASTDALIECGDMAQAQHSAMLAMTFTPHQRSSRMMRKLAEIAIINEDYGVAQKYLKMLSHTTLHHKWANERLKIIASDERKYIIPWVDKRQMIPQTDTLFFANQWRTSLINLLESNPLNKTASDYLLCFHLLNKDLKLFKTDYNRYYYPVFGSNPPRLYQEALIACMNEDERPEEQLSRYHISQSVYEDCLQYLSFHQKLKDNGRTLKEKFSKTYWFYYYYAQLVS